MKKNSLDQFRETLLLFFTLFDVTRFVVVLFDVALFLVSLFTAVIFNVALRQCTSN